MADPALSPRARLIIALVLAFGIATIEKLAILPLAVVLSTVLVIASQQGHVVLRRLRGPALLALSLMLIVPLFAGQTVLAHLGPVSIRLEGLQLAAVMALRLVSIVALTLALLAPLSPFQLAGALRGLGVPALMSDVALLTLRYLSEVSDEMRRTRVSRRLRGGGGGWQALPDQAAMLASALIRALARADRLWAAMRLRGYGNGLALPIAPLQTRDRKCITAAGALALVIIFLDRAA